MTVFCLCLLSISKTWAQDSMGQNNDRDLSNQSKVEGIEIGFQSDSIFQPSDRFSTNFLNIVNHNTHSVKLGLELQVPEGFELLYRPKEKLELAPGKSIKLPLRVSARQATNSAIRYLMGATVYDSLGQFLNHASYHLYMEIKEGWEAFPQKKEMFYPVGSQALTYQIRLKNKGNVPQTLNIYLSSKDNIKLESDSISVFLPPGADSLVLVQLTQDQGKKAVSQQIKVKHQVTNGKRTLSFYQELKPIGNSVRQNARPWYTAATTVEVLGQNINRSDARLMLNLQGNVVFNEGRSLFYSYRTNYLTNVAGELSGTLFNVNYYGKNFRLYAGDLAEIFNKVRNGKGIKAGFTVGASNFEILAIQQRDLNTQGLGLKHQYTLGKNSYLETLIDVENEANLNKNTSISSTNYHVQWGKGNQMDISLGYGTEQFDLEGEKKNFEGYSAGLDYKGKIQSWIIRSDWDYKSSFYPGIGRGVKAMNTGLEYQINDFKIGPHVRIIDNESEKFDLDLQEVVPSGQFNTAIYELPLTFNFPEQKSSIRFSPGLVVEAQDSLPYHAHRWMVNYSKNFESGQTIHLNLYYARMFFDDYLVDRTNRYNINLSWRKERYGLAARLQYGPFTAAENRAFLFENRLSTRLAISPYYRLEWWQERIDTKFQSDLNYSNIDNQFLFSFRNRNEIALDAGWKISLFHVYRFQNGQADWSLNLGVKRSLDVPLIGLKRYKDLVVIAYKDLNTNNQYDGGEPLIEGITIKIDGHYFTTNPKGQAIYKNVKPDQYEVDLSVMSELQGWLSQRPLIHQASVNGKKSIHYLPFRESKYISGEIKMLKDKYSNFQYALDRIRVTAVDEEGNEFSAFTNNSGGFFMNLPAGVYTLRFNQSLFEKQFDIIKGEVKINLLEGESYHVTFIVKEKKRGINIRRRGE